MAHGICPRCEQAVVLCSRDEDGARLPQPNDYWLNPHKDAMGQTCIGWNDRRVIEELVCPTDLCSMRQGLPVAQLIARPAAPA